MIGISQLCITDHNCEFIINLTVLQQIFQIENLKFFIIYPVVVVTGLIQSNLHRPHNITGTFFRKYTSLKIASIAFLLTVIKPKMKNQNPYHYDSVDAADQYS